MSAIKASSRSNTSNPSSRASATSLTSTQRRLNRKEFARFYEDLCSLQQFRPLKAVKQHLDHGALDIIGDRVKFEEWCPIISALSWDQSLRTVAFRLRKRVVNCFEAADTDFKARTVTTQPVITTKFLLYWLLEAVKQCLSQSPVLAAVKLEGLPLGLESVASLAKGLSAAKVLQHLSLYKCGIGDEGAELVCVAARDVTTLTSLDMSYCGLTEQGAISLVRLITHHKLNRYSEAWKQTLRYRDPDVEAMPGLRRITINNNPELGDRGIQLLAEELADDLWIRGFDVRDTGLTSIGGGHLLGLVRNNPNIAVVDARGNPDMSTHILEEITATIASNNVNRGEEYAFINREDDGKQTKLARKSSRFLPVGNPPPSFCSSATFTNTFRRQCSTLTAKEATSRGFLDDAKRRETEDLRLKLKELTSLLSNEMKQKMQLLQDNHELADKLMRCQEEKKELEEELSKKTVITDDTLELLEKTFSQLATYLPVQTADEKSGLANLLTGIQGKLRCNIALDEGCIQEERRDGWNQEKVEGGRPKEVDDVIWEVTEEDTSRTYSQPSAKSVNRAQEIFSNILSKRSSRDKTRGSRFSTSSDESS